MVAVSYLSHFILYSRHGLGGPSIEKNYFVVPPCDEHKEILTVRVS